jgi:hypothetical protein
VKKKRFSVEQIVATLKQIELWMTVAAASRQPCRRSCRPAGLPQIQ